MSVEALDWAWRTKTGSAGAKAVLVALANYADGNGYCWPGQESLAERTEQGERTVRRHLVALEEAGLISREARMRTDGRGRTSDGYYLALDQPANLAGSSGRPTGHFRRPTGHFRQDQPANVAGEPSEEPLGEPSELLPDAAASSAPSKPTKAEQDDKSFDLFWQQFPKRNGQRGSRKRARSRWGNMTLEEQRAAYRTLAAYRAWLAATDTPAKDAVSWLNQECWNDEWPADPPPASNGKPKGLVYAKVAPGTGGEVDF